MQKTECDRDFFFHAVLPSSQIVYISQGQQNNPAPPEVTDIYVRINFNHRIKSKYKTRVYHREGISLHVVRF
ncbi:unnamed protein product [Penicillium roqueforti FM164]|uniref:Genomic scaffold, ProqFM164S02 n=1 Tax=Penicillium roqueforti (strain FM164) TaxID=1365484 RepID=W6Q6B1_PENRF|nr:unnamed protein product [Penicillium roqueforti FM164]